jgi:hypothetical protein
LTTFYDPGPVKAAQRLRVAVLAAALGNVQGIAHVILHGFGELSQIFAARSNPDHRPQRLFIGHG